MSHADTAGSPIEQALTRFLQKKGIRYDYQTDSWRSKSEGLISWATLEAMITLGSPALSKAPRRLRAALHMHALQAQKATLTDVRQRIDSWPTDGGKTLHKWVQAVCADGQELSERVFAHWIWMVRRKLLGLPVTDHVCPILYGASGSGKSTEIRTLLAPVQDLVSPQTIDQVCDERHWGELHRHYIIYIDEMAGAEKAQLKNLKRLITEEYVTSHVFHSQRRAYTAQNASLLGSSNDPVVELLRDTTSARRYWEIRTHDRLHWKKLEGLDRRLIWTAANPREASPLAGDTLAKVQELQHTKLRLRPGFELWVEDLGIEPGEVPVPVMKLWESFREYCAKRGYYSGNLNRFTRQLSGLKFEKGPRKGERGARTNTRLLSKGSAKQFS